MHIDNTDTEYIRCYTFDMEYYEMFYLCQGESDRHRGEIKNVKYIHII